MKQPSQKDTDELEQRPLSWLGIGKKQREQLALRDRNLDIITEQSFEADTVKGNTHVNNSDAFSVDQENQAQKEEIKFANYDSKQKPILKYNQKT